MHENSSLIWRDVFECAKQKMNVCIKKLMKADTKLCQVHYYSNALVLTNAFFGCGIVKFSKKGVIKTKI